MTEYMTFCILVDTFGDLFRKPEGLDEGNLNMICPKQSSWLMPR